MIIYTVFKLQKKKVRTHSGANGFSPRSSQIGQVTTTHQLSVMKSGTIEHTHHISPSHQMLTSNNLQQTRFPCSNNNNITSLLSTLFKSSFKIIIIITRSISANEEASRSGCDIEVEIDKERWLSFV